MTQEFADWLPALRDVILEKILGWDELSNLCIVFMKYLLTIQRKVTSEKGVKKLAKHGIVIACAPIMLR
jgi:hypothetical protein